MRPKSSAQMAPAKTVTIPLTKARTKAKVKAPTISAASLKANIKDGKDGELLEQRFMVTVEMARHILALHNKSNRPINITHLSSIVRDIKNGHWIDGTGTMISFADNGNLIDGQHRLHAIIKSKQPLVLSFKFGLDEAAQRVIDTGRKRSHSDFIAMQEGLKVKYRTERSSVTRLLFGFLHDQKRPHVYTNNNKPTQSDLCEVAEEFGDDILEAVGKIYSPGLIPKKVVIGSYAAFLYVLAKRSEYGGHVDEFFNSLGTGANLDANDPIMVVRNRLMTNDEFRSQKTKDRTIGLLVKAWNHWINQNPVSNKMHTPDHLVPIEGLSKLGRHKLYTK